MREEGGERMEEGGRGEREGGGGGRLAGRLGRVSWAAGLTPTAHFGKPSASLRQAFVKPGGLRAVLGCLGVPQNGPGPGRLAA